GFVRELLQDFGDAGRRQAMIDLDVLQSVAGHVAAERIFGVLHDGKSASLLDRDQPRSPVVQRTRKDYPDYARAVEPRRGAEERIDRGPVTAFARAARETDDALVADQMMVRRSDVDAAV